MKRLKALKDWFQTLLEIRKLLRDIKTLQHQYNKDLANLKSLCQVGVDHHVMSSSWAVVCLRGQQDYVAFVELKQNDIRDIASFLRQYEKTNIAFDSCTHGRMMFKELGVR